MIKIWLLLLPFSSLFCATGITYKSVEYPNTYIFGFETISSVHVIEVDPSLYEIKPAKALDNGVGRESVLSLSKRYGAIASINGGFFSIGSRYDGKASGTLKIHEWYALPTKPRGCIGWSPQDQMPKMDRLIVTITCKSDLHNFRVDGLNCPRKKGGIVLFNSSFHKTTLTDPDGEEIVIVDGVIVSIKQGGSSKIPENGYVLSIQEEHPLFHTLTLGQPLECLVDIQPFFGFTPKEEWASLDYIVGGTPLLLYDHSKILDLETEQTIPTFLSYRHARTAIGILPNGHWLLVVVDRNGIFQGMTIPELADLMEHLGCVHALNLDGGGSSTMVYEGELRNDPQGDEDEGLGSEKTRRVSDAILIIPKNPS